MAKPESTVYLGREGTGQAQIFGREGNPFRAIMHRQEVKAAQEAAARVAAANAKKERDKKMFELLDVNPEETFQPFNQQVLDAAKAHRSKIIGYFDKGGDPTDVNFLLSNKQGWDQVNNIARKGKYVKDKISEVRDIIKNDPYMDAKYYNGKINDLYMDEYGNGKSLDEIDVQNIGSIMDDPGGFDRKKYAKDVMKDVKTNILNYIQQRKISEGLETRDTKVDIADFYEPDPNDPSGIKRNPDGTPVINVTPAFKQAFLANDYARRAFEQDAEELGLPVEDVIKQWIETDGPKPKVDTNVNISRDTEWYNDAIATARDGVSPKERPLYTRRWENINQAVNAFYNPDGTRRADPTPEAKVALGYLKKNMKMGGADVTDAVFVPANNTPGQTQIMGMTVNNSPNDRIVFKTEKGTRGWGKPMEINLADEGAGAELNSLFETAKTEGNVNISYDKLLKLNNANPSDVYKGRAGLQENNEEAKANENKTVAEWQKGKNLEGLANRGYDGKRIISAKKIKVEPGVWGTEWGSKYGIELTLETGDPLNPEAYATIPDDDYEGLAKVYRGEAGEPKPVETPRVTDQASYEKLPKGAEYIGPDGKKRRKN